MVKIFGNTIRAARGARNWFGGGVARALVVTAVILLACRAWAYTWYDGSKYTWSYVNYDGGVAIYNDMGSNKRAIDPEPESSLEIPKKINGKDVKAIANSAFIDCLKITEVTIPDGVKVIGSNAFRNCSALATVNIPESVTEIMECAFQNCESLNSIEIPDSVTVIEDNAFMDCESLDEVTLPASLVAADVKDRCFSGCSDDLEILSSAVSGGLTWHFKIVDGGAELCRDGENDEPTIPSTTSVAVVIPATLGGLPVVSIGEEAFMDCDKVPSVTIPETVTTIGDAAFKGCDAMADDDGFVIVRGVLHHYTDKDDEVTIPDGVTRIGAYAFDDCDVVERVTIPPSVTSIGDEAFSGCDMLEEIGIPAKVTSIGDRAFFNCKSLTDANIPDSVTSLGSGVFEGCQGLKHVTIGRGVSELPAQMFVMCEPLTSVILPEGVKSIGNWAFWGCKSLESIVIPKSVTSIGTDAFGETDGLTTVYVAPGEGERVKALFKGSGRDTDGLTFVEAATVTFNANGGACATASVLVPVGTAVGALPDATRDGYVFDGWFTAPEGGAEVSSGSIVTGTTTYYAHWTEIVETVWFTSRADAIAEARRTGKKIFLICGRDTCYNTMTTKNVSCEEPAVKAALTAKCVLWYSNCDTQEEENWYYWPMGVSVMLPLVCVIDPYDPDNYVKRTSGGDYGGPLSGADILAFIADIPAPRTPGSVTPAATPACYTFLDAGAITAPYAAGKTLYGALYDGCNVGGVVELKLGKVNPRKGTSRVSGSVTLLDGKRRTIKGLAAAVGAAAPLTVSLEVMKVGTMSITIGGDQFAGTLGKWHVQTAKVGGNWNSPPTVSVNAGDLSVFPGTVLDTLLPSAEKGVSSGLKWTFAKATSVKWAKPKAGEAPVALDAASGKGLIVDTSKDRTNLSGVRLAYTAKKGTFKGSFKVYALEGSGAATKLKKYSLQVGGVVVNGVGYGSATCRKPAVNWAVTVE